jgi:hypothetical protein
MSLHVGYEAARTCTGGPTPGAKALMSWFLGQYGSRGGTNLGIYACRQVRGSSTTSLHGEGRACDFGVTPHSAAWGDELAEQLRLHSGELGIQCVIWNRRIWSGAYPAAGFRPYRGTNPHVDHLHVELTRGAAAALTPHRVHDVLSGGDWLAMATMNEVRAVVREELGRVIWETTGTLPNRRNPGGAQDGDYADTLFGYVMTAEGTAYRVEQLVRQLLGKDSSGGAAGPVQLTDADVARIAAAVCDLLGKRVAA